MKKLRLAGTIGMVLGIYALIHLYIGWHAMRFAASLLGQGASIAAGAAVGVLAVSYFMARLAARWLPRAVAAALRILGSYWMAVMMYLVLMLPIADLIAAILSLTGAAEPQTYVPVLGVSVIIAMAIIIAAGSRNAWQPVIRRHDISVSKRLAGGGQAGSGQTDKLRIAVVSDLHLGVIVGNRHIERLLEQMERIRPDLILLAGDVIDDEVEPFLRRHMGDRLKRLSAPLGVYAVLGNHEYYGGGLPRYLAEMQRIGIPVLLDEVVLIDERFYLAGRKDHTATSARGSGESIGSAGGGRVSVEELLADIDRAYPIILMDHQPLQIAQAADAGVDISLSGHTHRGQLTPNHWITRRLFELDWGYLHKGQLHAFVSSGFGTWGPPLRLGSRCEVLQIDVQFEP